MKTRMEKDSNRKNRITAAAGKLARRTDRLAGMALCTGMGVAADAMPVLAAGDTSQILTPMNNLKTLVTAAVGVIGVIVVLKNVMELSSAIQNQESAGIMSALKGLFGGVLMAGVGTVLTFLGISA